MELVLYDLDEQLDPVLPASRIAPGDALLYTNYFGLKRATVERLALNTPNLIVDNAQDFYGHIPSGADGFVSCRKFFGVPDGAYLVCPVASVGDLEPADPGGRWEHLFIAANDGVEAGFAKYQRHEQALAEAPLKAMSPWTAHWMSTMEHDRIIAARRRNRDHLHAALGGRNILPVDPAVASVPMTYPYLSHGTGLRSRLLAARIYSPRYWPDLLAPLSPDDGAQRFVEEVVYLPVDQRYGTEHMDRIIDVVLG